ncbi:MAG TPA: hypothetical protein VG028_12805, partial [Terriglobia bacterium]|nr:hypothetical protein [Terriglobia bacterium]
YALKAGDAETLGGKPASAYMLSETQSGATASAASTNTVQTGSSSNAQKSQSTSKSPLTACSSVTSDGTATANSIALFTTACSLQSANLVQFNGNLGFGISTPGARLHIFGPDNTDSDARFNFILGDSTPATAGVGGGILFSGYYNGTTNRAGFANIRGIKENSTQGNYATAMVFDTRANGGNQTERMRISSAGNVGIGTSTPAAKLDVAGDIDSSTLISLATATGTTSSAVGAIYLGGYSFIHACCGNNLNTFIGPQAGNFSTTGSFNTASGINALTSITTGIGNTAAGYDAMAHNGGGGHNTANGGNALFNNTTGNYNTAAGVEAVGGNDTGNSNAGFGFCALVNTYGTSGGGASCTIPALTAGSGNTAVGTYAGYGNTTGQTNTFVGFQATASSGDFTNATAIGANAVVGESNALVLGGTGFDAVSVGIGTTAPSYPFEVDNASTAGSSDLWVIYGHATATGATTHYTGGVFGESDGESGIGLFGWANACCGANYGVYGTTESSGGTAGQFNNDAGGDILIGESHGSKVFRVDGTGKGFFNGGTQTGGADFAESVAVCGERSRYEPGDLLVIDEKADRHLALARQAYSTLVAGIYSTKPGMLATPHEVANTDPQLKGEVPLAVVGIVPCKVTVENGPIHRGDLLVTSSTPGYAMKGTDRSRMLGAVVGKALEPLQSGKGIIQVLVTLQ